ncbi:MAG: hypothetical protein ACKVP4_04680 [Hyphomicrobium sp.]
MTEADILNIRNDLTALVVSVFSVGFSMISAYIAGLWLFLKDAPVTLRALAFILLTCGLGFMGALTLGLHDLLLGTERAWSKLAATATQIPGFGSERPEWLRGFTMYEAAAFSGAAAFAAIYLALMYLTFFYKWPSNAGRV